MQATKKLARVLRDLVALLEEEAARRPEFAERLESIIARLPERGGQGGGARREESVAVPDVVAEFQLRGEQEFRFWLRGFGLAVLKAIVRRNGFDPAKASQRWTEPDKFLDLINEQVKSRLSRGSAFLAPRGARGAKGSESP